LSSEVEEGQKSAAQAAIQQALAADNGLQQASTLLAQMADNAASGGWTASLAQFALDGMVQAVGGGSSSVDSYALALAGAAEDSPGAVQAWAQAWQLAAAQQYAGPVQRAVVETTNAIMCHGNSDAAAAWEDVVEAAVGGGASSTGSPACALVSAAIQRSFSDCGGGFWYSASGGAGDLSQTIVAQCNPGVSKTIPGVSVASSPSGGR
jgi:hypothetical protein